VRVEKDGKQIAEYRYPSSLRVDWDATAAANYKP
jgi:hypothetical protein